MTDKKHKDKIDPEVEIVPLETETTEVVEDYKDQLLRLAAEFDNYRKRSRADMALVAWQVKREIILRLLPILDGLGKAIESTSEEVTAEGLRIIADQLNATLQASGLYPIEVETKMPFNPEQHDAIVNIATNDMPPGCVVTVIEKGYLLDGKLLRPARVGVSCTMPGTEEG